MSSASAGAADAEKTASDNTKSDASLAQNFVFIHLLPSKSWPCDHENSPADPSFGARCCSLIREKNDKVYLNYHVYKLCILNFPQL